MNFRHLVATGAALASFIAGSALAHPKVSVATPAANAVTTPPKTIILRLSEKLEPKFSGLQLMKADGTDVPVDTLVGSKDGKTMEAAIKGKLKPGRYMVMWHAVAGDGHRVKGDYFFTVR